MIENIGAIAQLRKTWIDDALKQDWGIAQLTLFEANKIVDRRPKQLISAVV
jgi:hypothetical protein